RGLAGGGLAARGLGLGDAQRVRRRRGRDGRRRDGGRGDAAASGVRAGAGLGASPRDGGRRGAGELLAVAVPVLHLRVDLGARVLLRDRPHLFGRRDLEDLAGLQAVHVVARERFLVLAIERDEHLLQAHVGG